MFFFGISRCFFAFYKQIHKNKSLVGHVGASGLVSAILPQAQTHTHTNIHTERDMLRHMHSLMSAHVCGVYVCLLPLLLLLLATCLRIEIC